MTLDLHALLPPAVAAGFLGLDRLAWGQFMVSQPMVAAPVIGALLGDLHTGLFVGVVLELFWLRGLPVGGHVPGDATLSAVLTTALCLLPEPPAGGVDAARMAWAFLWVGVLLLPCGFLEQRIRRANARLIGLARSAAAPERGAARAVWAGILIFFLYYVLVTAAVLGLSLPLFERSYAALPGIATGGLRIFLFLVPVIGLASLMGSKDLRRGRVPLIAGGTLSLFLVGVRLREEVALLILLAAAAVMLLMLRRVRPLS